MNIQQLETNDRKKLEIAIETLPKGNDKIVIPGKLPEIPQNSTYEAPRISWFEYAIYWIRPKIGIVLEFVCTVIPQAKIFGIVQKLFKVVEPEKKQGEYEMEEIKGFLTGMLVRWILKIGGTWLLTVGITEGSVTEIITAIVGIVVGLVISLVQHKKAVTQEPVK